MAKKKDNSDIKSTVVAVLSIVITLVTLLWADETKTQIIAVIVIILLVTLINLWKRIYNSFSYFINAIKDISISFWESCRTQESREFLSTISSTKRKRNDPDDYIKKLLVKYMNKEKSDIEKNFIYTSFSNYSELVKTLIEHSQSKIDGKIKCVTQNAVCFIKWYNFYDHYTNNKWIDYLDFMYNLSDNGSIEVDRYMAFVNDRTLHNSTSTLINKDSLPFFHLNNNDSDVDAIKEKYLNYFKNIYLFPASKNKHLNDLIKEDNFNIKDLYFHDYGQMSTCNQLFVDNNITLKNENYRIHSIPFAIITDNNLLPDYHSVEIIEATKTLFHTNNPGKLYGLYIDNLNEFYHMQNQNRLPFDFFSICEEKDGELDVKIILAASASKDLELVKLCFLTKNLTNSYGLYSYNRISNYIKELVKDNKFKRFELN